MLTLDCFRPVGLYSDRVHVVWIDFLTLTDKQPLSFGVELLGEAMSLYIAFNGKLHAVSLVWLARPSHLNAQGVKEKGRSSGSND